MRKIHEEMRNMKEKMRKIRNRRKMRKAREVQKSRRGKTEEDEGKKTGLRRRWKGKERER